MLKESLPCDNLGEKHPSKRQQEVPKLEMTLVGAERDKWQGAQSMVIWGESSKR